MNDRQNQTESEGLARGPGPSQPLSDEVISPEGGEAKIPDTPVPLASEPEELPEFQDETKVVLLPVNPYLVHVYWEVDLDDQEKAGGAFARPAPPAQPVLRFYDVTSIDFDGTNAHSWFDIEVDLRTGNWYVPLQSPAKSYCTDLGLRIEGQEFQRLARSNVAETPRAWPSDNLKESYLLVESHSAQDKAGAPSAEPADMVEAPPETSAMGEPCRAEEQKPEANERRVFPRAEMGVSRRKPPEVVETLPETPPVGEPYHPEETPREANELGNPSRAEMGASRRKPPEVVEAQPETSEIRERHSAEERKPEPQELAIFRTALPGEIERRLKEFYQGRREDWSGVAPNAAPARHDQLAGKSRADLTGPPERNVRAEPSVIPGSEAPGDLTDLSERSFRAGVSSGGKP